MSQVFSPGTQSGDQNIGRKPINPHASALCVPWFCRHSPRLVLTPLLDHTPTVPCLSPPATDILSANGQHCSPHPPITLCQRYLKGAVKILVLTPCRLFLFSLFWHIKTRQPRDREAVSSAHWGVIPVRVAQGWCSLQKDRWRNSKGWQEHWLKKTMSKERVTRKTVEKG